MPRTLYLIDGHAQIFRAFFAIRGGMNSPVTGEPTNATFAFTGMLLKLLGQFHPTHVIMVIDMGGKKNFREELYPEYKSHRPPVPPDLIAQEPRILEITKLFGIPVLGQPGVEADDILACLTQRVLQDERYADMNVKLVTKDKDLEQLLCDRVTLFDIHNDTTLDTAWLKETKGITPEQVVDLLALTGDTADNIPGAPGIGPKTAAALVHEFGSVENILANLDKITGKKRESLEQSREILSLSKQLVTLKKDLPLPDDFQLDRATLAPPDANALREVFQKLGFHRHVTELNRLFGGGAVEVKNTTAPTPAAKTPQKSRKKAAPDPMDIGGLFGAATDEEVATESPELFSPPPASDCDYRCISNIADLQALVATLRDQKIIAVDTETTGLERDSKLCGISLAWQPNAGVYVAVLSPPGSPCVELNDVVRLLGPVLENPTIAKTGHNLKFDYQVLKRSGITLRGITFDTMIASYLLNMPGHGIDHLSLRLLGIAMTDISALIGATGKGKITRPMNLVPLEQVTPYASADADIALRLYHLLKPKIDEQQMTDIAQRVEMPLVSVLAEMELAGIRVDGDELERQKQKLSLRITELRDAVQLAVGEPFNLDSPKQLGEVLFTKLKLPGQKRTQSGYSTDIEVLEKLVDLEGISDENRKICRDIVEYRQLTKLVGTYLTNLQESISKTDGRVHTSYHQAGAATGRLSSNNPNLQNIPIRTSVGREIRKAFLAESNQVLVSADYSQIELRILAHLSHDPALKEAFEQEQDIHTAVASQVFNVPLDAVTKEQRGSAKSINFGIIYGVTPYGLARRIEGMDVAGAKKLITDYRARYAGIDTFLTQCIEQAKSQGFVSTILGHRREIPQIHEKNPNVRSLGERLAINSVVQGSAADLIKLAMVNLHARIVRENLPAKLLLQIHDELVLETPAEHADKIANVVRHEMEHAMELNVPLRVEVGIGQNWLETK